MAKMYIEKKLPQKKFAFEPVEAFIAVVGWLGNSKEVKKYILKLP